MTKRLLDIVLSVILIVGSAYFWHVADSFPVFERFKAVDSDYWPKLILVAVMIMASLLLIQSFIEYLLLLKAGDRTVSESPQPSTINRLKLIGTALLILGYFFALEPLGFLVSTIIFLYIAENIPSYSNWKVKVVFPLLFTAVLMFFFIYLLSLSLPRGKGIFYDLSILFY